MKVSNKEIMAMLVVALVSLPITTYLQGYVLTVLWSWFVVPTFIVKELSVVVACGLMLIVKYSITDLNITRNKHDVKDGWKNILMSYLFPLAALLFGYIIHLFA